jgi:GNAT superfamily N-acetyltransferase
VKIRHSAFIDLENALGNRVGNGWKKLFHPIAQDLRRAISDKNWHKANEVVDQVNTNSLIEDHAQYAQTIAVSALLLGASRISSLQDSHIAHNPPTHQIRNGVAQWGYVVAKNAAQNVKLSLHLMLARLEHQSEQDRHTITKFDPDEARDDTGKWTAGGAGLATSGEFDGTITNVPKNNAGKASLIAQADAVQTVASDRITELDPARGEHEDPNWKQEYNRMDALWSAAGLAQAAIKAESFKGLPFTASVALDKNGKLQGAMTGGESPYDSTVAHLSVLASFQRGAGSKLLHTFEQWAAKKGYKQVWLSSTTFAEPFYQSQGYTKGIASDNEGMYIKDVGKVGKAEVEEPIGPLTNLPKWFPIKKDEFGDQIDELNLDDEEIQTLIEKIQVDGADYMSLAANLMVSRLSSFGFLYEAQQAGIEQYEISAILDDNTCPVCEALDGQIFSLQDGIAQAKSIMDAEDADSLRTISPWPSQSKSSVADLQNSDAQDLVDSGLSLPPYHAGCRCIAVASVDDQADSQSATADAVESLADTELPRVSDAEIASILGLAGVAAIPPILFGDEDDEEEWEDVDADEDDEIEDVDEDPIEDPKKYDPNDPAAPKKKPPVLPEG